MPLRPSPAVDVHLTPDDLHDQLANDARIGFTAAEKWIPATWFYDDAGCELFDRITELDEYYPTRSERSILAANADEIADLARPATVVELGSGTSEKTTLLLDAFQRAGTLRRFVPFDVSESTLVDAMARLGSRYPIGFHGVVGDFRRHLTELFELTADDTPRLVVFLGGTIGNLNRTERHAFYTEVATHLRDDDRVLIGTDLVKERARLVAAYDDASGVTAAFNRNVLAVLNQRLGADFDPDRFEHRACFHEEHERIEMRLRSTDAHHVWIDALDLAVFFSEGEEILTEISCKFTPDRIAEELDAAGFSLEGAWTDPAGDFQVSLGRPAR
jgi:L-histidine N-alpha-methyltransferase